MLQNTIEKLLELLKPSWKRFPKILLLQLYMATIENVGFSKLVSENFQGPFQKSSETS